MIDYDKILNKKVKAIKPSGIRRFFDLASDMEGVISLGVGEPDFKTPYAIRNSAIQTLQAGKTWYTANAGLPELKKEICSYLSRRFDLSYEPKGEVIVTVGGSEAIDLCIRSVIEEGDEIIIPEPSFVCYDPIARLCGGKVVGLETRAEDGFRITPSALKSLITDKTKLLIFPFPNNPTGAIMEKSDLEEIAKVLKDTNILVLSDEIYAELTYEKNHVSIASIDEMRERTIVVGGFSKAFAMTGWRLGYACGPKEIMKEMLKVHQFAIMCAPTTSQYSAITALRECQEATDEMRAEFNMRRKLIVDGFNQMGLRCFSPEGAFYVFPSIKSTGLSSEEFCEKLLFSKKVAVVPGTAFGECGEGYVRVSYSYSISHITTALKRIEEFLAELKQN